MLIDKLKNLLHIEKWEFESILSVSGVCECVSSTAALSNWGAAVEEEWLSTAARLLRRRSSSAAVEEEWLSTAARLLRRRSSPLLQQPQFAAAVAEPVRIPPQFESFYTLPIFSSMFFFFFFFFKCGQPIVDSLFLTI